MRTVQVPGYGPVKFPENMSDADIALAIERDILPTIKPPAEGLGAALVGGAKRLGSTAQTALESILDPEGAARRGLERQEEISRQYAPGADLEKVISAYREKGLLPAAGEAVSQIPGALAEQAPNIAATLAGARAGARFGLPGAAIGAATPALAQLYGSFLERQAEEGQPVSRGAALAAAAPGAALEVASMYIPLGRSVVGKLLGPEIEKALAKGTNEAIERVAKESLGKTLAKGTALGIGVEGGTEVAQTMLERLQAGLPLTTPDALTEYGQAAYGGALVGGPFGAVGRVGERGVARGKVEEKQAEERRLQEELAAAEREQAAQAEEARKATPEYRQELNNTIWTLKDELAQIEPIAKDKTQDEDVRNEAIARAKEIKAELKTAMEEMKTSMKQAGLAPTLEKAMAEQVKAPVTAPVIDEYGNIVKPKTTPATEEEYGQQLEGAAKQWDQTREKIFELREKDIAEQEAKKQKVEAAVDSQVQRYLRSLDEYDTLLEEEKIQKGLKAREETTKEITFQRAMERIQKVIDNFGFNLIGYQSDPTIQQLKTQIADLSRPEAIAAAPDRNAYLQQLDTLKTQLADAVDNAPRNSGEGLRRLIDEGRVTRDVTSALGITGLGGRSVSAADALPNIQARIDELEEKRQEFTKRIPETSLMEDDGTLTKAGVQLVKNEVKLNELKRLQTIAQQQAETGGETAAAGILEFAAGKTDEYIPVEKNLPGVQYNNRIQEANKKAAGAFDDIVSFVDDLSKKRFFGGAPGQVGLASTTEESLRKNIDAAQTQLIDGLLEEVATARVARKLRPLSQAEATGLAMDVSSLVDMLVTRSTAPAPGMVTTTKVTPAQMRGTKIVKGAEEVTGDFRGVRELPFGASAKKAKMMSPEEQEKIAKKLKEFRAAEREATERLENADKRISELKETPDSPLSQELAQARAQAFEDVRTARAAKEQYKQAIKSNFASTGITAKQALQTVKNVIRSIKQDIIAEGQRPVRADKGTLQLLKTPQKAAPADLVKDLDRVLRMENLLPDVRNTLEAARRRMEEGGISAELEELIDEQVGRILRGTDRPFEGGREVTPQRPFGTNELKNLRAVVDRGQILARDADFYRKAELVDDIKARMRFESETAQYATAEDRTLIPSGKRFAEVDVQPDLFPETAATARTTPAQFQRLQKSKPVQEKQKEIAAAKATAQKAAEEARRKAREKAALKAEITPARQVEAQMQAVRNVLSDVMEEYKGKKQAEIAERNKQISFLMKSVRTRAIKRMNEITNAAAKRRYIQDVEEDLAFHFPEEAKRIRYLQNQISDLQKQQTARLATLDQRVQNEVKFLKTLEKRAALAEKGTPEQRKAQKQAALVRGQIVKAEQVLKETKEAAADRESERVALRKLGLGLPGISVKAERRELAKGKGVVRRSKIVPILTKEEAAARIAERKAELADLERPLEKDEVVAALKKIERLTSGQRTTQTKLYLEAAADAKRAQLQLENYIENLRGKEPNKQRIKALRDEVDETANIVRELNRRISSEIAATYRGVEEPAIPVRKATTRGPVGGEAKGYDKKFTPDQMRQMSGLGLSGFSGKSYSVDDNIDFRIGDTAGGGIDLEEANKRMAGVEQKAKSMGVKFKYFPTMKDVTLDILNDMERQGVDVYETQVRGGVKPDGTVFVIGENHTDMADLEKTIAHEFVGHYTFESILGEDGMTKLMVKVDKSFATKDNENGLEVLAKQLGVEAEYRDAVVSAAKFYEQQLTEGKMTERDVRNAAKTKGLREIIAYTMEKRVDENFLQKAKRWIQELVGAFRAALKSVGLVDVANMSTSDLFYLMKQANKTFEEGKPIAYRKADGSVDFALTKPKYAPGLEELGAMTDKIVGRQEGKWNSLKANLAGLSFRVQFVDRFAALEALANRGVVKGIIDSLKAADMLYFARMTDQRHSFVSEIATNGTLKLKDSKRLDGRIEKIIESERGANLKDISQTLLGAGVGDGEATGRLFTLYLAAERAMKLKDGIQKLNFSGKITKEELQKALNFGRSNAAFQKAREMYNEYNRGLIDFAVQTGAISKERGAELNKQGDYIPYYRMQGGVVNLFIGGENPIRIGDIKNQPYLQELVGGDEAIMDFFTSSLQNTTLLTDLALRNLATRNVAFTLKDLGVAEIHNGDGPADRDVIRFSMDEVGKDGKVTHRKKWARINTEAKQELFGDIPSDLIVKGMEGMQVVVPGVVRMMGMPANWVRKFVTRDPRYAVRQIFRDSLAATLTTGANIKPVVDTMGEIVKMYGKGSEAFKKLQQRGVLGGQVITGAPEDMAKIMQQIASGKPGWDLAMAKLDQFAMAGDAGTRIAMYNSFLKQGLSEREATLAALESMNFGRRGVSPSMYFMNATIPFFNAGVQGIDVLYRAFKGQMPYEQQLKIKKKLYMRGAMIAMFTMAYAAMMQDDEAYKNAEPDQRYGNWFVRIPGIKEPFKVPIPFEVGLLFKAVPEGIYNALFSKEKGEKVAKDLTMQVIRSLPGNLAEVGVPLPTAIKPFIEIATNTSLFTGRDVVDARLDRLEKSAQYRDKTPELIKLLGQYTHFRIGDTEIGFSPVQLEHITRALTGSLGIGVASLLNPALRAGAEAGAVEGRVTDLPIIGGMFQPNDAGRVINDAYETVKMVERKQATYKALISEGKIEEAQEYVKRNVGEIGLASYAGAFRQQMGDITKAERAIKAAPEKTLSPEEKRERLDQLRQVKIQLADNFRTVRDQIERQAAR